MIQTASILAAAAPDLSEMAKSGVPARGALGNFAVILLVVLVVALLFVVWVAFIRKPPGRRERGTLQEADESRSREGGSSRRRRRRRTHRGRNPTLSEIGGLPPLRDDEPPEPRP